MEDSQIMRTLVDCKSCIHRKLSFSPLLCHIRYGGNVECAILQHILITHIMSIYCDITLRECHRTPAMISEYWFRLWLDTVRQQAITLPETMLTKFFCRQMAPLGVSELIEASPIIIKSQRFAHPNSLEQKCVIAVKHYQHARCIMYLLGHYRHIRDNMIVFCNLAHTCLGLGYLEPQQRRQPVDAYQYSLTKCHEWIWIWDWSNHF